MNEMVLQVDGIDPDRMIFDGIDTTGDECPKFSTAEVGKFFFARSSHWMRWRERKGHFVLKDGESTSPLRSDSNQRVYSLADVERLAHALASNHAITPRQLMLALKTLQIQGQLLEFF